MGYITFLIGNGFDIKIGLKTQYKDFYREYTKLNALDSELIRRFKTSILKDKANEWVNWADFELGMGKCLDFGGSPQDFLTCYDNFVVSFNEYLKSECSKIDWDVICKDETILEEFANSIVKYRDKVQSIQKETLRQDVAKKVSAHNFHQICILQFNYTNVFDELKKMAKVPFSKCFNDQGIKESYGINSFAHNLHIHGEIGEHPIIGVDNAEQIIDEKIKIDSDVSRIFVKQNYLESIQNLNVNAKISAYKAPEIIRDSNTIVAFGVSIGDTDKYWWKIIGDWLINLGKRLIIFDVYGGTYDSVSPLEFSQHTNKLEERRKIIFERFVRLAGWTPEQIAANSEKIIIELDSEMFNFKLPRKEEKLNANDNN